jgi:prephenate dehydratase
MAELPNKPGSLHGLLAKLAKKGINLRSIAAASTKAGRKSVVVYTTDAPAPSTAEPPPPQQ